MDTMLKLDKVSKFYSSHGVVAVGFNKVSLEFHKGEFVAVTGESGSGKSTLMNVISGLDSYEEGELYIYGEPTSGYSEDEKEEYRKKYIGNIFQTFNLVNSYTVYQNVELVLLLAGYRKKDVKERVEAIIEKVGLSEYKKTKVSKLSGGQKQRVAIARALAQDTPVIVADEPTGNLDVKSANEIIQLLHKLSADRLIIIVTHNYEQVQDYITRRITMHDGRVIEDKKVNRQSSIDNEGEFIKDSEKVETVDKESISSIDNRKQTSLTTGGTIRLGVRNTFSLPGKFILLFMVFFFLCAGIFSEYTATQAQQAASSQMGFSEHFQDTSPERLVISKKDNGEINKNDIDKLKKIPNIKLVDPNDILRDSNVFLTNGNVDGDINMDLLSQSRDSIHEKLVEGRPAEKANEAVIFIPKKDEFVEEAVKKSLDKTLYDGSGAEYDDNGKITNMDSITQVVITGYGYINDKKTENMVRGFGSWHDGILALGPKAIKHIQQQHIIEGCRQEIQLGTRDLVNEPNMPNIPIKAMDSVEKGKIFLPAEFKDYYKNGYTWNQKVGIENSCKYFDRTMEFTIGGLYTKHTAKPYYGIENYSEGQETLYINTEDYDKLFNCNNYQCSLFMENTTLLDETVSAVEKDGYNVLPVNKAAASISEVMNTTTRIFTTAVMLVLFVVFFFISYFIIRLIFKSRNGYFSTIRMIGATRKNCSNLMVIDLFCVFNIAYFVYIGILKSLIRFMPKASEALTKYVIYIDLGDYVILYLILMVMSVLIAKRYSKKMFKQTVMNAYKEEV